ncbi:MAG: HEAT repeat domain-containing protein [Desulfobacterales bacterium]
MNNSGGSAPSHPLGKLFIGLVLAQILATIQVYLSNIDLHATVTAVSTAGYLTVPNQEVMGSLQNISVALYGGLFFTFTVGTGVTLATMAAAWIWGRMCSFNKFALLAFAIVWLTAVISVNLHGFCLLPSLYFVLIPPVIFGLTAKNETHGDKSSGRLRTLVHLLPIPLLALIWFTQFDRALFLDLRDNLLLSNFLGRKFSEFYYTYTLYPAEAFKSLDQKIIKTFKLENINARSINQELRNRLIVNGYLPLPEADKVDLRIIAKDDQLAFQSGYHGILQMPLKQFLSDTPKALQKFSQKTDCYSSFRRYTFLSLLIGFPILIYLILHAALYYILLVFLKPITAAMTASVMCLIVGSAVLIYFQSYRSANINFNNISNALESESWQTRLAALKAIQREKLEIADYRSYPQLLQSPIPQERYWLVRALAFSRRSETYADLLAFVDDENINVRCMAFYSLGLRRNPRAIKVLKARMRTSNSWYDQMYAYKALRSLGWKQNVSP